MQVGGANPAAIIEWPLGAKRRHLLFRSSFQFVNIGGIGFTIR